MMDLNETIVSYDILFHNVICNFMTSVGGNTDEW